MTLQVIGAGFGRTGTTSLKAALEQLGFSKCHHMQEVMRSRKQVDSWQALADGGTVDWDQVFDGFRASCDWPSCTYWEELSHHYPDAKIILTVRDEDRWYDSCATTIHPFSYVAPQWILPLIPPFRRFNRLVVGSVWDGVFSGRFEEREHAVQIYRDHIAHVRAAADPDRLLVFEAKDGWVPLCQFLGVPVPDNAYPHLNDGKIIKRVIRIARILGWLLVVGFIAGVAALVL